MQVIIRGCSGPKAFADRQIAANPSRTGRPIPPVYELHPVESKHSDREVEFDDTAHSDDAHELGYGGSAVRLTGDEK
jgi:hypothetical protein